MHWVHSGFVSYMHWVHLVSVSITSTQVFRALERAHSLCGSGRETCSVLVSLLVSGCWHSLPLPGAVGVAGASIQLRVHRLWECGEAAVRLLIEVHLEQIFVITQCVEGVAATHPALHLS